jgi:SAM-dependent methyltransferase
LTRRIEQEFIQLQALGWDNLPIDEFGIRKPKIVGGEIIHFPQDSWDENTAATENAGYWAQHRAKSIAALLLHHKVSVLWEIGAGNGNVAINLKKYDIDVIAVEPLEAGARILSNASLPTYQATLDQLSLPDCSLGAIGLFDVLEHLDKPRELLSEVSRVLKPGGVLICSVPAHQWLFSDFDERIGHFRRYSMKSLRKEIRASGFQDYDSHFLFGFLLIPAFVTRRIPYLLGRRRNLEQVSRSTMTAGKLGDMFNSLINAILVFEERLKPISGLSILMVAKK